MRRLYVTTATGVVGSEHAPVGGGVAVLEALLPHLALAGEDVVLLRPGAAHREHEQDGMHVVELPIATLAQARPERLLELGERAYARFALEWEAALADFFAGVEPAGAVVLANDVSEGPPFAALAARGFRQVVLYHVVVAAFFARRYLRDRLRLPIEPATAARAWRLVERLRLARLTPKLLRLVWQKEAAAARHAHAIVPSAALAGELTACYPESGVEARTLVVPWGVVGEAFDPARRAKRAATLASLDVPADRHVVLTMSRISPEKRIELLLDALAHLAAREPAAAARLAVVIAGAPAYMGGGAYLRRLHRRAARLSGVTVRFAGYLAGESRADLLAAADLLCSTSSYEAYGLTIAQALASGTPVLATDHQGAQAIVAPSYGWIVPPRADAIAAAVQDSLRADLRTMRRAAAAWGAAHPFADRAARIVGPLTQVRDPNER